MINVNQEKIALGGCYRFRVAADIKQLTEVNKELILLCYLGYYKENTSDRLQLKALRKVIVRVEL